VRVFLDTNIIVYLYTSSEDNKRLQAAKTLTDGDAIISTQVLNELSNVLSRKFLFNWKQITKVCSEIVDQIAVLILSINTIQKSYELAEKYNISFFDSLIVASAIEANCEILYSEDLQHNQIFESTLKVINPFR